MTHKILDKEALNQKQRKTSLSTWTRGPVMPFQVGKLWWKSFTCAECGDVFSKKQSALAHFYRSHYGSHPNQNHKGK